MTIFNQRPLINQTIDRIKNHFPVNRRYLIIPAALSRITRRHTRRETIIIEPLRRNTAAAICLAAKSIFLQHGDSIVHVMSVDHIIEPARAFNEALSFGTKLALAGYLVTYGITPDRPETGYGYIKVGRKIVSYRHHTAYQVVAFKEKPTLPVARRYLANRRYLWNAGIFTMRISVLLHEMKCLAPRVLTAVEKYLATGRAGQFARAPDIAIDYAVMERSKRLAVVRSTFRWDDVGSWLALERFFPADAAGNIRLGDAQGLDITNSIMYTTGIPIRAYGIQDLIVVATPDGILICHKSKAALIKNLLKEKRRTR